MSLFAAAMLAGEVKAAPISARAQTPAQQLRQFWASGRYRWAINDPLPRFPAIRVLTRPNGTLRDTPLVDALERRRDRNPSQFDRGYFRISPLFRREQAQQLPAEIRQYLVTIAIPRTSSFQILIPPGESAGPILAEQSLADGVQPAPVPEPGGLATGVALLTAGAWWCRARRRRD